MAGPAHSNHGNTVAAWTAVGILTVAALIMSIAVVVTSVIMFVVGGVIAVAGVVTGKVLSHAGYGAKPPPHPRSTSDAR